MSVLNELRAPAVEIHQGASGAWNWVLVDHPNLFEPAIVIWDSTPFASAEEALADVDGVLSRNIRESGF